MIFWETKFKYAPLLLQGEMIQQLMNPAEGSCWPSKQTQEETPEIAYYIETFYFYSVIYSVLRGYLCLFTCLDEISTLFLSLHTHTVDNNSLMV